MAVVKFAMGIFDWLKGKRTKDYEPVNRLETMLVKAASDPLARPEFLNQLFHFDLFTLGKSDPVGPGESPTVQFEVFSHEGIDCIAAFTSVPALQWHLAVTQQGERDYIGMSAHALFTAIQGKHGVFLNPGHAYGKIFTPEELGLLLKGQLSVGSEEVTVPVGTGYLLGQPADLPRPLIEMLARYVASGKPAREIFFGLKVTEATLEMSFLAVVQFADGFPEASRRGVYDEIISVCQTLLPPGKMLDLIDRKCGDFEDSIRSGTLKRVGDY